MQIIAMEGIDKCGKATQTKILTEKLRQQGFKVVQSEFHRYDTPTGKLIQDWLFHRLDCDKYTVELIMAADKQLQQQWFHQLNEDGVDFLVLDRYLLSQEVYAVYKGVNKTWLQTLQVFQIKPNAEILIDIPADVSMSRNPKYGANGSVENDRHEKDYNLLNGVHNLYLEACGKNGFERARTIIDGTQTMDKVSDDIWNYVKNIFKI